MRKSILFSLFFTIFTVVTTYAQEQIVIESTNLKCNDTCLVFSPQQNISAEFPTLFLLHGWSGCYKDWSNYYDIQEISNRTGFRIICPDGFYNSWYLDNIDKEQMQYRKFWNEELFPLIEQRYNIKPESTFITGLSMGGHGAINIYLDNPDNYRSAGSMSGVLNLNRTSLKDTWLSKVIGPNDGNNLLFNTESALYRIEEYVNNYPQAKEKCLVVSCGYKDVYAICTTEFAEKCKELGIPHYISLSSANHSWKYWGFALENHIWLFTKILKGENLGE